MKYHIAVPNGWYNVTVAYCDIGYSGERFDACAVEGVSTNPWPDTGLSPAACPSIWDPDYTSSVLVEVIDETLTHTGAYSDPDTGTPGCSAISYIHLRSADRI